MDSKIIQKNFCASCLVCGKQNVQGRLRPRLPKLWYGTCTLIHLMMPTYLLPMSPRFPKLNTEDMHRVKRDKIIPTSFDSRVYLDSIGVPRGVPNEFKARNQVAAGFESFFTWWVTINKNVDWINYIYYNQQRFINYTRDGFRGIHEQLDKTSLMAWQNRLALDMLLAEKGGVCKLFGNLCCTFIPNNTAPDGSITRALEGLTSLSDELADNSGITDPITKWMESIFGRWGNILKVLIMSVGIAIAVLITCGCCCIPCMREVIQRLITTTLMKQQLFYQPVSTVDEFERHEMTEGQGVVRYENEDEYEEWVQFSE
ncbi:Endogenous retrovirus group V member 2 [Larimichthys crocea]|uniref:Endogenous retrovirus group V member 2 n=1 Tax=Larimichthys crocea TaxID=215358 RepID=A0A6G0HEZ0_LARCR|nr:Endogenous retrovirus group V member 2 [Larimichthys crocea]